MRIKKIKYNFYKLLFTFGYKLPFWGKILGRFERPNKNKMNITTIPIDRKIEEPNEYILTKEILFKLIDKANTVGILNECLCRVSGNCQDYPHNIGCLVLGETVKTLDESIGRVVTKDRAKRHIINAIEKGLYPTISHYNRDAEMYSLEFDKMLTICMCCPCHCLIRKAGNNSEGLNNGVFSRIKKPDGVSIVYDNTNCLSCKRCIDACFVGAISYENDKIVINHEKCKGCGRCVDICSCFSIKYDDIIIDNVIDDILKNTKID